MRLHHFRWIGTFIAIIFCWPHMANSQQRSLADFMQSRVGTTSVSSSPQFADGRLYGCLLEYNGLVRDDKYQPNGFSKVFGSFGLMESKGHIGTALKVVVLDFNMTTGTTKANTPANAHFVFGHTTSRDSFVSKIPSDTPGGLFAIYRTEGTFEKMAQSIDKGQITLAFNRRDGGADILVPIEVNVSDTDEQGRKVRSPKAVLEFYECTTELLKNAQAATSKRK